MSVEFPSAAMRRPLISVWSGPPAPLLVFDYFGSWSRVPAEFTIAIGEALECARRFIRSGAPGCDAVLFEPDRSLRGIRL